MADGWTKWKTTTTAQKKMKENYEEIEHYHYFNFKVFGCVYKMNIMGDGRWGTEIRLLHTTKCECTSSTSMQKREP